MDRFLFGQQETSRLLKSSTTGVVRTNIAPGATGTIAVSAGTYLARIYGSASSRTVWIGLRPGPAAYADPQDAQPTFDQAKLYSPATGSGGDQCLLSASVASTICYNNTGATDAQLCLYRIGDCPA